MAACGLGSIVLELEEATAGTLFERSLVVCKQIGDRKGTANALFGLAEVAQRSGDAELARRRHDDALRRRMEIGDRLGLCRSLERLAELELGREGGAERAIVLLAAVLGVRETVGARIGPWRRVRREQLIGDLRATVGDERFDSLWVEGLGMPLDVAYARAAVAPGAASPGRWPADADHGRLLDGDERPAGRTGRPLLP
jgi:Tetratricopeptide repeat